MSKPRGHHFVPRTYLRQFALARKPTAKRRREPQVFATDLVDGRSFTASVADVAQSRDFNRLDLGPDEDDFQLERQLSTFEGELSVALKAVEHERSFSDEAHRSTLFSFMSLLATRSPRMRANIEDFQRQVMQKSMDIMLSTPERYEAMTRRMVEDGYEPNAAVSYESLRDFFDRGEYTVEFSPNPRAAREFGVAEKLFPLFAERRWRLLCSDERNPFVTTDHPLVLFPLEEQLIGRPLGVGLRNVAILLPLSNSMLLAGTYGGPEEITNVEPFRVALFNTAIIHACQRQVYARDDRFFYVSRPFSINDGAKLHCDPYMQRT